MAGQAKSDDARSRVRLMTLSLVLGVVILVVKVIAFQLTGSSALESDAIESVVNVVGAGFGLWAIGYGSKPADAEHPYGHGKMEHFSAIFEGGLVSVAAVIILYEGVSHFIHPQPLRALDLGLALNLGAGCLNGALGFTLKVAGRRLNSAAMEADGHHVLGDFWSTLGIGAGLLLVRFTGFTLLDPMIAVVVGVILALAGARVVRKSSAALLDTEDQDVVKRLVEAINRTAPADIIHMHELRTMRAGRFTHVDVHLVVPEYYPVARGHDLVEGFARRMLASAGVAGEGHIHMDPCHRAYCTRCGVQECPIRAEAFIARPDITRDEATAAGRF